MLADLASLYAHLKKKEQALMLLAQLVAQNPAEGYIASIVAATYEELGKREQALTWIGKALDLGYPPIEFIDNPELEDLQADARFQDILRRHKGDAP